MARYKGHEGSASAGGNVIGEVESFDVEISSAGLAANVLGSDWTDEESGMSSASGTVNVLRDPADTGQAAMTVGDSVAFLLYPEGDSTGMTEISGNFRIVSRGTSVSAGDLVKDTYSIQNKGTVTIGTVS
jgi:hypothetical protein